MLYTNSWLISCQGDALILLGYLWHRNEYLIKQVFWLWQGEGGRGRGRGRGGGREREREVGRGRDIYIIFLSSILKT